MGTEETVEVQKQLLAELEHLEDVVAEESKEIGELEIRLELVLNKVSPPKELPSENNESILAPLAEMIRSIRYRVMSQNGKLSDLLTRLEL